MDDLPNVLRQVEVSLAVEEMVGMERQLVAAPDMSPAERVLWLHSRLAAVSADIVGGRDCRKALCRLDASVRGWLYDLADQEARRA